MNIDVNCHGNIPWVKYGVNLEVSPEVTWINQLPHLVAQPSVRFFLQPVSENVLKGSSSSGLETTKAPFLFI